ncbi:hypothetical protein SAMN02745135_01334 [Caloranaerobacter azorensis DSM 13643]|uniref:DUF503 domain-containing protein n=1 Tax=Caloranaerobacter azorensis DSM 13643 TaxID=1121264 RepID=A0A1M5UAG7_9FIRM|nr:DUF503 domain-containing protein [Caloranaerobacter azorensis]SHH60012.1 hypothetical protein SAMN02745135_01334 [Caloranaerobacter azorensis DSM 13643]
MIVGTCKMDLFIYEASSLKEKRHVIKSLIGKIQSRYNVSIAEIDLNDTWKKSAIGFACVTNDTSHANSIISNVINFIENDGRVEITNYDIEIL